MADLTTTWSSDPTLVMIESIEDVQRYLGANDATLGSLNHRLYKDTACGAHISVLAADGWHHNGTDDWTGTISAILFGSIVEGSDAEVAHVNRNGYPALVGEYRGFHVEMWHKARGQWSVWIDNTSPAHFDKPAEGDARDAVRDRLARAARLQHVVHGGQS